MKLVLVVLLGCAATCLSMTNGTIVPVVDANLYFTEHNWFFDPSGFFAQSVNPGSYFKLGFTGSTSCIVWMLFDTQPSTSYMTIRYTLDGAPYQDLVLPGDVPANGQLVISTSLNASVVHELQLWIKNSVQEDDRWGWSEQPVNKLCIRGIILDAGAHTVQPPSLRSKRLLIYWDSIGEGVRTLAASGTDLTDNDSTCTWADSLAAALDAELNAVAFGGQGYASWGSAIPLITPGNASLTAWNQFYANHSRLNTFGQLEPNPDYVLCGHGTNDGWDDDASITALALAWMSDFRKASPNTFIFLVVPFGGFFRDALHEAFSQYQEQTPDKMAAIIDLGSAGGVGISAFGQSTVYSGDGLHPLAVRSEQLGAMLAVQIASILGGVDSKLL